jgi:hypothetical protein
MKKLIQMRTLVLALAACATVSCAKEQGGGRSSPSADDNVTATNPAAAPAPSSVAKVGTQKMVLPAGTNPETAPAPQVETPAVLPSPAVLQAVTTAQGKLDGLAAGVAGSRVRFVDCNETASCTARLEAQSLSGLRDLLQSVSQQQGGIGFVAREQLDGFTGRTFVADVTLGGSASRAVPTDENELLVN